MKLDYQNKKWEKEITSLINFKQTLVEGYLDNVNSYVNRMGNDKSKFGWYCIGISGEYRSIATIYVTDSDIQGVMKSTFLSIVAFLYYRKFIKKGLVENYWASFGTDDDLELCSCMAISINCIHLLNEFQEESIIGYLYKKDITNAKRLLDKEEDYNGEVIHGLLYEARKYLKPIYSAINSGEEKAFNEEISKRIRRDGKNMDG